MSKAADKVATEKFVLGVADKLTQRISEVERGLKGLNKKIDDVERRLNDRITEVEQRFDQRFTALDQKLDRVLTQLDSIAGQFRKFDEEQTVLAHRQSIHSDQIEKLEVAVFGAASSA